MNEGGTGYMYTEIVMIYSQSELNLWVRIQPGWNMPVKVFSQNSGKYPKGLKTQTTYATGMIRTGVLELEGTENLILI